MALGGSNPCVKRLPAILASLLAFVLAVALAGCGEKSEDGKPEREDFTLILDFYPNPDHMGIYVAEREGYFKDAGLDVEIEIPSDTLRGPDQAGGCRTRRDLAISYEPELLLGASRAST